jgi:hypothetical protein
MALKCSKIAPINQIKSCYERKPKLTIKSKYNNVKSKEEAKQGSLAIPNLFQNASGWKASTPSHNADGGNIPQIDEEFH